MKQYTNETQTAKLIELGFSNPESLTGDYNITDNGDMESIEMKCAYSIGELIEMLPDYINGNFVNWKIQTTRGDVRWSVGWDCFETEQFRWIRATELIDALYDMVVSLNEEEVI